MNLSLIKTQKINYADLNAKQQESYNFQKVSAELADYGFTTLKLPNDWNGADFIAVDSNGNHLLVQLKGRLTFDKKYIGKNLYIAYKDEQNKWIIYHHDTLLDDFSINNLLNSFLNSKSWIENGGYHWQSPSKDATNSIMNNPCCILL